MVELGGRYLYSARDPLHGTEIWSTDGTPAGTAMLADLRPGVASSSPVRLARAGSRIYFFADDGAQGLELWATNGTPGGTAMVADLVPGAGGLTVPLAERGPFYRGPVTIEAGGQIVFLANAGTGLQVWRSDGTVGGTIQLTSLGSGATVADRGGLGTLGGEAYFVVDNGGTGNQAGIWKTDGTPGGTARVATCDGGTGAICSCEGPMIRMGQRLFFDTFGGSAVELWATDGTPAGTGPMTAGDTEYRAPLADKLLFVNETAGQGRELWVSDGTPAGTTLLVDLLGGPESSDLLGSSARLGSFRYFQASDATAGSELWRSDGTTAGTSRVIDLRPGLTSSHPRCLTTVGAELYFAADGPGGASSELWKTDGTAAGTALVADLASGPEPSSPCEIVAIGETVILSAWDAATGRELRAVTATGVTLFQNSDESGSLDDWSEAHPPTP
jgi:ELWxxDGT repeat protein